MGHAVRSMLAPQAAVDAMFRQAGVIQVGNLDEMFDVAQLVAHQPLPRGNRVAVVGNSDALGLLAADAAAAEGLQVKSPVALGADASAEDFEDALDAAIDDPEVDSVVAVFIPPLNTSGDEVANVLAAVGEQSDKPLISTFLASEGIPELLRVPDVEGSTAGRGSVPSYPAVEAAVRALARVVEYAAWRAKPLGEPVPPDAVDAQGARAMVTRILAGDEAGRDLTFDELHLLLGFYGIDLWERQSVATEEEAIEAAERFGYDVVLKATAEHLRQRPDLAHVWRNIDTEEEMRDAWRTMQGLIDHPEGAGFIVQKVAGPGVPVSIGGMEDPLFGPVVSFGVSGPATELLGDRSYRIPPMRSGEASDMVREIRAAPLLFGYRGSEKADVDAIEHLLLRIAQLKNDLPQVRSLELTLVLAGVQGATVLDARGGIEPVPGARSDWFVRRLSTQAGDTLHD
jgi:acyl-CoA synthetase (NDP forming)